MRFLVWRTLRLAVMSLLVASAVVLAVEILVRFFAPYESEPMTSLHTFFLGDGKYQAQVYDNSPMLCGLLKGRVINISRKYIRLFAEYEGEDIWSTRPRPLKIRIGCQHELRSLPLVMTWPGMQPQVGGGYLGGSTGFQGIRFTLSPLRGPRKYMHANLISYLGEGAAKKMAEAEEVLPGLRSAYGYNLFDSEVMYWNDINSANPVVFKCRWSKVLMRVFSCDGRYLMEAEGVEVAIYLSPEKMLEVLEIVQAVKKFVTSHLE